MRFTRFRSQRNATGIFLKAEAALEQPRKVCAARLSRRKPKPPTEQPRESARGCEPSRTPSPRGCRGAERPTPRAVGNEIFVCIAAEAKAPMSATRRAPVSSGTKFSSKPPRKQKCRREKFAARLSRRKPKPPTEQPRESARGCEPSRTPSPRGSRGAECPAPRAVGNEIPARTAAKAKAPMNATRRAPVLSGTKFSCKWLRKQKRRRQKPAARLFRRRPNPPTEQPRESARGLQPSRLPIKRISRREIVSFSHRGWQWRGSLLPRPHTTL